METFPEIKGGIPSIKIEQYYVKKKTYYVNVGTHGFFLMGNVNPFGLGGIPKFSEAITAKYRARVQDKGGGNYQFTFEMSFSPKIRSPFLENDGTTRANRDILFWRRHQTANSELRAGQ